MVTKIQRLAGLAALVAAYAHAAGELPGYYRNPGLEATRSSANHTHDEHIDPFGGMLQLHHADMTVPGNGGFDLILQRSFNNPGPAFGSISDTMSYNRTPNLGVGWSLLIGGRVLGATGTGGACTGGNQLSFETPDGHRHAFIRQGDGTFLSASRWKAICVSGGVQVYATSGTRYDMLQSITENIPGTIQSAPFLYPTRIEDRNANYLTFAYGLEGSQTVLNQVDASDGRTIRFTYGVIAPSTQILLSMVTVGSRNWTYYYRAAPAINDPVSGKGVAYFLVSVEQPAGGPWGYAYNDCGGVQAGACALSGFAYPEGGQTTYSYGVVNFNDGAGNTSVITGKSQGGVLSDGSGNSWQYAYTPGSLNVDDQTVVTTPLGTITYRHVGASTVGSGSTWKIGLLTQRVHRSLSSATLETETLTWDKQQIATYPTLRVFGLNDGVTYAPLLQNRTLDRNGSTFSTTYGQFDTYGNPTAITEMGGRTKSIARTYVNDTAKWIIGVPKDDSIAGVGNITRSFDGNGNLVSETKFGVNTSYAYFGNGALQSRTDANLNVTSYSGYVRGTAQTEQRPAGVTIARTVDPDGNITSQSDGAGNVYSYTYDGLRRMTSKTPPRGTMTNIAWNGAATRDVMRGGYVESTSFDGVGSPYLVTRSGVKTLSAYDPFLRKTYETLPGAVTQTAQGTYQSSGTTARLDLIGRVTSVTNPDTSSRSVSHTGNASTVKDELNRQTTYQYWSFGDPQARFLYSITPPPSAAPMSIWRDDLGNITSVTQGPVTRTYQYNGSYFLVGAIDPETGTTTYERDNLGNMTARTVGGKRTTFGYDGLNRLTSIVYPTSGTVGVTYLGNGRTASVTNPTATRSYGYDANANLTSESLTIDGRTFTVGYTYDGNDALSTITYPMTSEVVSYYPDSLGRPSKALPYINDVTYFDSGNPQKISYASGVDQVMTETTRQWPLSVKAQKANESQPAFLLKQYAYDGVGNLTAYGDGIKPSHSLIRLQYDSIDQLTYAQGTRYGFLYAYDQVGNRTQGTMYDPVYASYVDGPGPYTPNTYTYANNRLQSLNSTVFSYDGAGNITSSLDGSFGHTYQYDDASNLVCADCGTGMQVTYAYDGNNRRVKRTSGSQTTYYVQAANGDILFEYTVPTNLAVQHIYLNGKRVASKRVQF